MPPRHVIAVSSVCFVAAFACAALTVLSAPGPARWRDTGFDVRVLANNSGALALRPAGTLVDARNLRPGGRLRAKLRVRNITPVPLIVRLRAVSPSDDVDELLHVRIQGPGRPVFGGSLARLRHWTRELRIRPGQELPLRIVVRRPERVGGGLDGRAADVTIETSTRRAPA